MSLDINSKRSNTMVNKVLYRTSFTFQWHHKNCVRPLPAVVPGLSLVLCGRPWSTTVYRENFPHCSIPPGRSWTVRFNLGGVNQSLNKLSKRYDDAYPLHLSEQIKLFSFSSLFKLSSTLEIGLIVK